MKTLGVMFLLGVIVIGAFTSIQNVSAQIPDDFESKAMKSTGTYQQKFGSQQTYVCGLELCNTQHKPKVCGAELCNSKSIPNLNLNSEVEDAVNLSQKELALEKALQGGEASEILAKYNESMGTNTVVSEPEQESIEEDFHNFGNPDFYNSKSTPTLMREHDPVIDRSYTLPSYIKESYENPDHHKYMPVQNSNGTEMIVEEEVQDRSYTLPSYIKESYANSEYPQYVPKEKSVLVPSESTEITHEIFIEDVNFATIMGLTGLSEEDLLSLNLGVCGKGTVWNNGVCVIATEVVNESSDWIATTKDEDNTDINTDIDMTDGTQSIPIGGELETLPIEESITPEIVMETLTVVNGTNAQP